MTQSHTEIPTGERGLQPTLEELSQNTQRLITLRWAAGISIILSTIFVYIALSIDLQIIPLLIIGVGVLGYNWVLASFCQNENLSLQCVLRVVWIQILLDWLAMFALVHVTGGITSPALIYFVIHAALSGTILLPWQARSLSVLAIVIVGGLSWLERIGWLPHVTITELGLEDDLYRNTRYITAIMVFFGSTVLTLSELVSRNAQRLRQRENHIRELYDARSTFVRVATHELRAPLGASLSLMRNIEQGYAGELTEQQSDILSRVTTRLEGLRTLIEDLLTLAISREAITAHAPLKLDSVQAALERIIEREKPHAEQKHITLHTQLASEPGIIMAGKIGLEVILGNLLNNAIKYTPSGGTVTVTYTINHAAQTTSVSITDTGIGIPADALPHVFDDFFRAMNAKQAQIQGTGIGLSTVQNLVTRYHGNIVIHSEEGQGTTVQVTLPLAPDQTIAGDSDDH